MHINDVPLLLFEKVILAIIMLGAAVAALFVCWKSPVWTEQLLAVENECEQARDSMVVQGTMLRSQLYELHERLTNKQETSEFEAVGKLVVQAKPVVDLFLNKERNLFKWAMTGYKLVNTAIKYFSKSD